MGGVEASVEGIGEPDPGAPKPGLDYRPGAVEIGPARREEA
jgi:hypothetical protein